MQQRVVLRGGTRDGNLYVLTTTDGFLLFESTPFSGGPKEVYERTEDTVTIKDEEHLVFVHVGDHIPPTDTPD